jgi:hypothetical protein
MYRVNEKSREKGLIKRKVAKGFRANTLIDEIEGILLQILEPKLNKQGPKWRDAVEFVQMPYEQETELEADIVEVKERLRGIEDLL